MDPSYLLIIDQEWVASILTGVPPKKHFGDSSESSFLTLLLLETWVWHALRGVSHLIEIITYKNVDFSIQASMSKSGFTGVGLISSQRITLHHHSSPVYVEVCHTRLPS